MMLKPIFDFIVMCGNGLALAVGWTALILFGLSIYPPLSFLPKLVILFVLTH